MFFGEISQALSDFMGEDGKVTFITGVVAGINYQNTTNLEPTSYTVVGLYSRSVYVATVSDSGGYETNDWTALRPATKNLWYETTKTYSTTDSTKINELIHEQWIDYTDGDYVILAAGDSRCVIVGQVEKPRINASLAVSKWETPGGADELAQGKDLASSGWTVPTAAPNTLAWHSETSLPTTTARSHPDLSIDRFGSTVSNKWMQAGKITEIRAYGTDEYSGDYTALDELSVYRSRREALGHQFDLRQTGANGLETVRGLKISPASAEESNESTLTLDYTPMVRHNQLLVVINKLETQLSTLTDEYNSLRADLQKANTAIATLDNRWALFWPAAGTPGSAGAAAKGAIEAAKVVTQTTASAVNQNLPTASEKTACRSLRVKGAE